MAVTVNTGGIIFADSSYQTTATSSAYSRSGYNRTEYSGSNVTLNASSAPMQSIAFTGYYYTVTLPQASTLTPGTAPTFTITNFGKFPYSIYAYGQYRIYNLYPGETVELYLLSNNGDAGLWSDGEKPLIGACYDEVVSSITPHIPYVSNNSNGRMRVVGLTSTKFMIVYAVSMSQSAAVVCEISGFGGITYGTPVNFGAGWCLTNHAASGYQNTRTAEGYTGLIKIDENTVLAQVTNTNQTKYLVSITISGTTPTFNSGGALNCGGYGYWGQAVLIDSSTGMVVLSRNDGESGDGEGYNPGSTLVQSVTCVGSTVTAKSSLGVYSNLYYGGHKIVHCGNNVFVEVTGQTAGGVDYAYARPFTVNTTTGTFTTGTVKNFNQSIGIRYSDYGFRFAPYGQKGISIEYGYTRSRVATFSSDGSTVSGYKRSSLNLPPNFYPDQFYCSGVGMGYPSGPNPTGQRLVYSSPSDGMIYLLKFNNNGEYVGYDTAGKTSIYPFGNELNTYTPGIYSTLVAVLADNMYVTVGWSWSLDIPYISAAVIRTNYKD